MQPTASTKTHPTSSPAVVTEQARAWLDRCRGLGPAFELERHPANPILSPNPANPWEASVTTNPGAWLDPDTGRVTLLYRAAGHDPEHRVVLGMAVSDDGVRFERTGSRPVFEPSADGFDAGCVEDPRIVRLGDAFYITYAARPTPPGQYWIEPASERPWNPPPPPEHAPWCLRENQTATGLAITRDFSRFVRAGRLTSPMVDDRDVILFPETIGGDYVMMHRPMQWAGPGYPTEHPTIWITRGPDLLGMGGSRPLLTPKYPWESKLGGNTPPIRTPDGWLTLFHAVGPDKRYRLGALLLDLEDPSVVRHRTPRWLMQPEADYELEGFYTGCIFPCGKVVRGGRLMVYYGGADRCVALASCELAALLEHLRACPA